MSALAAALLLSACAQTHECSDLIGTWKGNSGTLVIDREGSDFTVKIVGSPKKLYMQCKDGTMSSEHAPLRGSLNGAGYLVLDGFASGAMETYTRQ